MKLCVSSITVQKSIPIMLLAAVCSILFSRESNAQQACNSLDISSAASIYKCALEAPTNGQSPLTYFKGSTCSEGATEVQNVLEGALRLTLNSTGTKLRPSCEVVGEFFVGYAGKPVSWVNCQITGSSIGSLAHITQCLKSTAHRRLSSLDCTKIYDTYGTAVASHMDIAPLLNDLNQSNSATKSRQFGELELIAIAQSRGVPPKIRILNLPKDCSIAVEVLNNLNLPRPSWADCVGYTSDNALNHLQKCLKSTGRAPESCAAGQESYFAMTAAANGGSLPTGFTVPSCSEVKLAVETFQKLPVWVTCGDYETTDQATHMRRCLGTGFTKNSECLAVRNAYEQRLRIAYQNSLPDSYEPKSCALILAALPGVTATTELLPKPQPTPPPMQRRNENDKSGGIGGDVLLLFAAIAVGLFFFVKGKLGTTLPQQPERSFRTGPPSSGESRIIIATINKKFDAGTGRVEAKLRCQINDQIEYSTDSGSQVEKVSFELEALIARSVGAMARSDREMLRVVELLNALQEQRTYKALENPRLGLIYGDGKAEVIDHSYSRTSKKYLSAKELTSPSAFAKFGMRQLGLNVDTAKGQIVGIIENLQNSSLADHPLVQEAAARLRGGAAWASEQDLEGSFDPSAMNSIYFGTEESSGTPVRFSGEGSIITIAAPGSGKTQANVLPNLLEWDGPAIVLDVKGEIFDATAEWRAKNVGPVYKFAPMEPDESHCFNPLDLVRSDPEHLWEDARFLASMIIVPSKDSNDPFWDNRAQDFLTAAIAAVCLEPEDTEGRSLARVTDYVHSRDIYEMLAQLQKSGMRSLERAGTSWESTMTENGKQFDSILSSAQTAMTAWESAKVERVIARSDWHPFDLREGPYPTIYISLKPGEIDVYSSLLRVFVALHIRTLVSKLPKKGVKPILFMLDELPRLKYMPPIEEALEVGRQYGIKLWMFAQSLGQLEKAYPNANGMIGSCAVRSFMNPSMHDGTAERVSKELGTFDSPLDGSKQKISEPQELAGAKYKSLQLILPSGAKPIKATKNFAYNTEPYKSRMTGENSE